MFARLRASDDGNLRALLDLGTILGGKSGRKHELCTAEAALGLGRQGAGQGRVRPLGEGQFKGRDRGIRHRGEGARGDALLDAGAAGEVKTETFSLKDHNEIRKGRSAV